MRRILLLAAMLFAQPALAADWSPRSELRPAAAWTGAYAGAFGGVGVSSGRAELHDYAGALLPSDVQYGLFPLSIKGTETGGVAGVGAGMNFQSGGFVFGVEADLGYAWTQAHHVYSRLDDTHVVAPWDINTNTRYETDFGALATLRARGGYAFGDTLLYGTAGVAAGHVANRFALAMPEVGYASPDWSASGFRFGYALGAGIEQRLTDSVSLKFEALYVNLADRVVRGLDPAAFPGESISYKFTNDIVVPRLGINVRF